MRKLKPAVYITDEHLEFYRELAPMREIGAKYGFSKQRAWEIVHTPGPESLIDKFKRILRPAFGKWDFFSSPPFSFLFKRQG
jgi:hypothetical protein